MVGASISAGRDWSLERKGFRDQARHAEKIRELIRKNLPGIVAEESIITSGGNGKVRIPIRQLEEYRFRFSPGKQESGVGQGQGGSRSGDVIGRAPVPGSGSEKAGSSPGEGYYEVELSIDELAEILFEDLALPNLRHLRSGRMTDREDRFEEIIRRGPMSNLDKRRTLKEALRRQALHGEGPHLKGIRDDDLRFKTWREIERPRESAVVFALRDISGSMGEFERYISRSVYFWITRFLRTRYQEVEIVFVVHDARAWEVGEEEFFHLGDGGGTVVSTAYDLALEILDRRFPPAAWNSYAFHFSDGDNFSDDNRHCLDSLRQILRRVNLFGYGEISRRVGINASGRLRSLFRLVEADNLKLADIREKADVWPTIRTFFGSDQAAG